MKLSKIDRRVVQEELEEVQVKIKKLKEIHNQQISFLVRREAELQSLLDPIEEY